MTQLAVIGLTTERSSSGDLGLGVSDLANGEKEAGAAPGRGRLEPENMEDDGAGWVGNWCEAEPAPADNKYIMSLLLRRWVTLVLATKGRAEAAGARILWWGDNIGRLGPGLSLYSSL